MTDKEFNKYASDGEKFIDKLNEELTGKIRSDQQKFLDDIFGEFMDQLERNPDGTIKNSEKNYRVIDRIDHVFDEYSKHNSADLIKLLLGGVGSIFDMNSDYFSLLDGKAKVKQIQPKVKKYLNRWIGLDEKGGVGRNGYLDQLVKMEDVRLKVKQASLKMITSQKGYEQARKDMQTLIAGDKKNLGALERYHRNYTYDLFSQIDRAVGRQMGNELGMKYAIYSGDIIKTSRIFCIHHAGNVYHISEIMDFDPPEAKQPDYDPIHDLGGYGCRHVLRWISLAMAKRLRPEIMELFENKN